MHDHSFPLPANVLILFKLTVRSGKYISINDENWVNKQYI